MTPSARIAVTGMAWLTALGEGLESVWQSLLEGQTGFRPVPTSLRLRNRLAAPIPGWGESPFERMVKMTCHTIRRALLSAGREPGDPDVQFVLGTSLGSFLEDEGSRHTLSEWAAAVSRELGSASAPIVVSTACSSGADAIMVGAELIRAGAAKCFVCGGTDILTNTKRLAHTALGTMSPTQLRTFDVRHDGTLLGEGAGFMVLEPETTARRRIATFLGGCSANDATGMTMADETGLSAGYAMRRSLADANLQTSEIGLINAHGSGTHMSDTTESNAFASMFLSPRPPIVFATKGNFGHSLGATGAIEAIALVLALNSGLVPPIHGLEKPLPGFRLPLAMSGPNKIKVRNGLSLTLGFGGFDTSLVFEAAA